MQIAYIDEAGYTGADLLNAEQPFMALSALFISKKEAADLREKYFPQSKAPELKHNRLARRPSYYDALLSIQRTCLDSHRAVSYVVDKKYMCILKLLNDCIEPVAYTHGIDFYEEGHHLALASLLHVAGPVFWGKARYDRLLQLYQRAVISKTRECVDDLCGHVKKLRGLQLAEHLFPVASKHPAFVEEIMSPTTSTNVAFSLLSGLITRLEATCGGAYEIVHDRSPAMKRYHRQLDIIRSTGPERAFSISDVCHISYPLQMREVTEADSKSEMGLQLADLLAGGVVSGAQALSGQQERNSYNTNVIGLYSNNNIIFMLPNTDFEDIRRSFSGSQMSAAIHDITHRLAEE